METIRDQPKASEMATKKRSSPSHVSDADFVEELLKIIEQGKKVLELAAKETIYLQGDQGTAVYFIKHGKVRISVVSVAGKEATLLVLGPREFFGEGCLVGHTARLGSALTLERSTVVRVDKSSVMQAIESKPEFAHRFIGLLLARNTELEEDLCDQLFNQSEKRLARALLKLARFGKEDVTPDVHIPSVSQEILAELIGTTRPRVNYFMNKFRRLGLIDYNDGIIVRAALLTDVVLSD
jgi:CRP-like cAMP-binding protein